MFGLLFLLLAFYNVDELLRNPTLGFSDAIRFFALGAYGVLFVTERRTVHAVLSLGVMASIVLYIGTFSYELGQR